MTVQSELRLKCLELAKPSDIGRPDVDQWIERARKLEAYCVEGQAETPPKKRRGRPPKNSYGVNEPTTALV